MIGPVIDQIAGEYQEQLKVGKVNVDENADLSDQHGISSIPTLILYKDGALAAQKSGAVPKNDIIAMFQDLV
jgi:thioredoxin 1